MYMFNDLRDAYKARNLKIETIAVVRAKPADLEHEYTQLGLDMLKEFDIVRWNQPHERVRLLEERKSIRDAA